jgi:F-type H+-transporting ATPase subunit c
MKKLVFVLLVLAIFALPAAAQDAAGAAASTKWAYSAIGLGIAVAAAAYGQSKVASAVAEGIARNPAARPGIQLALFLGLAFIESLVLFIWLGLLFLAK